MKFFVQFSIDNAAFDENPAREALRTTYANYC